MATTAAVTYGVRLAVRPQLAAPAPVAPSDDGGCRNSDDWCGRWDTDGPHAAPTDASGLRQIPDAASTATSTANILSCNTASFLESVAYVITPYTLGTMTYFSLVSGVSASPN